MLISVVIPTHYRSFLLKRAIDSALEQSYNNIEIIVISDGEDAKTDQLMQGYCKEKKIRYYKISTSRGGNYARNYGVHKSQGSLVAFLDDDDEWLPDKLASQFEIISRDNSIGLVYTGINVIYVKEKASYSYIGTEEGDLSRSILTANIIGTTSSVLVKKTLLEDVGLFDVDLPAMQDYDLWIRLCQVTKVGLVKNEKVNYYNYTNEKQVSLNTEKYNQAREIIFKKYTELFDKLSPAEIRTKKARSAIGLAKKAIRNGEKKLARSYIKEALFEKPSINNLVHCLLLSFSYKHLLKIRNLKN